MLVICVKGLGNNIAYKPTPYCVILIYKVCHGVTNGDYGVALKTAVPNCMLLG